MHPEIKSYLENNPEPQSIDILIADSNGILRGKQYPGDQLESLFKKGAYLPKSLMFGDVRGATPDALMKPPLVGDPDINYQVIEGSLCPVPWASVPTAQVFLRATEAGQNLASDPLTVLETVIARLEKDGLHPVVALEGEFYLLDPASNPPQPIKPENQWPAFEGPQVYALEPLRDVQHFLNEVKNVAEVQGIPLTSILCEYGESQFEMNLNHSGKITDHARDFIRLKHAIKNIAEANGQLASFMAQPLTDSGGSGCHIHVSILDSEGNNVFGQDDSKLLNAIGGLMETMSESMGVCAPFANSYRRYKTGGWSPNSGNWGRNHRLVSLRIPISGEKDKRVEHRIAGADVNPYLLLAAVLSGVHHGIKNRIDPGPESMEGQLPEKGNAIPARWREALHAFSSSEFFKDYFGEEFMEYYCRAKFAEEENFHTEVSDRDYGWCLRTV
jgi:glutamine synthetase